MKKELIFDHTKEESRNDSSWEPLRASTLRGEKGFVSIAHFKYKNKLSWKMLDAFVPFKHDIKSQENMLYRFNPQWQYWMWGNDMVYNIFHFNGEHTSSMHNKYSKAFLV